MRQIKFRIGNVYQGKYTRIGYEMVFCSNWVKSINNQDWTDGVFKVKTENPDVKITRDQYTGRDDKNGVEIYERDRVKLTDEHGNTDQGEIHYLETVFNYVILWSGNSFRFLNDPKEIIEVIEKDE